VNNLRSTLAIVWRIAVPYFRSEDKWAGRGLLATVIAIELALVGIDVLINQWQNRFFNALQERNWDSFVREIGIFTILAFCAIGLAVYQLYLNQWLQIRWRRWMTTKYLGEWLHDANHYRMQLLGDAADNPDQRIQQDIDIYFGTFAKSFAAIGGFAALADPAHYTLVTPIDDGPFVWKSRGAPDWEPTNYDKTFHGAVPLRTALAHSYNAATARLGTDIGVEKVLATIKRLGIEREMQPYASTLLGAVDLSPLEVAQMYQTIASGGFRTPLRAIREVTTQDGRPLRRYALAVEQAFAPEPMHLLAFAMQDVVHEGTAQSLKNWVPVETGIAGKTGTTDEQRDAWFAGFSGDRLGIVWIGYDDNRAARLSGAGAALPVWGVKSRRTSAPISPHAVQTMRE